VFEIPKLLKAPIPKYDTFPNLMSSMPTNIAYHKAPGGAIANLQLKVRYIEALYSLRA
jgi:hypothetical protein